MTLNQSDILRGYDDERWLGFGYLGERKHTKNMSKLHVADSVVLRMANQQGWDYEQLFIWLNSRPGRHFGDLAFGWGRWSMKDLEDKGDEWELFKELHEGD